MTLVFGTREVSAGPTVGLQPQGGDVGASSPDAYVSKEITTEHKLRRVSCFLEIGETLVVEREEKTCQPVKPVVPLKGKSVDDLTEESDDSSSSTVEDGEEEVQSKFNGAFSSMGSLEESLPIKRGLSNFYSGKSKSFANLSEITTVTDLVKQENPFNKRRRTLIACKWSRKTFSSSINLTLTPSQALKEDEDEEV